MNFDSNTIEYEFRIKYGCYPYTYLQRQLENGLTWEKAMAKVQKNIDLVWSEMKLNHKRMEGDIYEKI